MFLWSTLCKQDEISKKGGERCIESTMKKEENYQGLKNHIVNLKILWNLHG